MGAMSRVGVGVSRIPSNKTEADARLNSTHRPTVQAAGDWRGGVNQHEVGLKRTVAVVGQLLADATPTRQAQRQHQTFCTARQSAAGRELRAERDETCHPDFGRARFQGRRCAGAARGPDLWVWGHGLQTLVLPPALMRAQAAFAVLEVGDFRLLISTLSTRSPTRPLFQSIPLPLPLPLPLTRREGTIAIDMTGTMM